MVPFQSMTTVTVYIVFVVFFLVLFSLRKNPFYAAGSFVQEIFTSRKFLFHFIGVIGILFINKLELSIEKSMRPRHDFTSSIYKIEGDFSASIQHFFHNDTLTYVATFFYVVVFPALMIASILIYTYQKNYKLFYALCYAIMFNYIVAIPFYLFFPVNEVWSFRPNVSLLINDVFPSFETEYRPLSGLDNCFPSLHTSISVTLAVLAFHSRNKFWQIFVPCSAAFIIFTIFYLGIHWLTDMCAGVLLGVAAARIGMRISEGRFSFSTQRSLIEQRAKKG
ncbi:phosphatase PAP2 family protein [Paenibacillus eucommiae]|uniref:Membrane-associated phospholipid phosphatase n=1 Tax=Paenibacillus eucommiae TaxID=1355755 RepID=A0ABS4JAE3_9BACL|nr:phosphatase PAP2 family protein [Paenibacillus eucommiae]MBP1996765.1 membrane-associated phospholipid phosphatase [Paenibacillus eucommiae]